MNMKHKIPRGLVSVRADAGNGNPGEVKQLVEALNKAFADFKAEHNQQLEDIKKGNNDALQALKVDRINDEITELQASIDEISLKLASAQMSGGGPKLRDPAYSEAFHAHFKKGEVRADLNKGTDGEGGYLTPIEWDRTITDALVEVSPMRQLAQVQPVGGTGFSKLFNTGGTSSGWVGETDPRPKTGTAALQALGFGWGEIYANPAATQQILDDTEIDLEAWLAGEVQTEFAKQEGSAFVAGNGTNKPFGILTYVTGAANAGKHPLGAIAVINSGDAADITADGIIDLVYDLPSAFTGNARFGLNRRTLGKIRKLKNANGDYLWQPSLQAGQPSTILGFGVAELPDMPDVAANGTPVLFGDFKRTYLILDRVGVRVLRDPFTNKPFVQFYTTKRVGGGVQNPEPMRALKIAA